MKRKLIAIALTGMVMFGTTGCQFAAKNFGGSYTEILPKGQKLVNVTWKKENLWCLTRPMKKGEEAETYTFKQNNDLGIMEGTVTIKEVK